MEEIPIEVIDTIIENKDFDSVVRMLKSGNNIIFRLLKRLLESEYFEMYGEFIRTLVLLSHDNKILILHTSLRVAMLKRSTQAVSITITAMIAENGISSIDIYALLRGMLIDNPREDFG